jgi:Flp pilus assembly pilin Flp
MPVEIQFTVMMWQGVFARFDRLRHEEGGASVLEWALIAAVVVVAASIIGAVIMKIVQEKADKLTSCSNSTSACS